MVDDIYLVSLLTFRTFQMYLGRPARCEGFIGQRPSNLMGLCKCPAKTEKVSPTWDGADILMAIQQKPSIVSR